MTNENVDQKHPQNRKDRATVDSLLKVKLDPSDRDLAELARLIIRYRDFPGARDIQRDLKVVLDSWELNEEQLYDKTRLIHAQGLVYRRTATGEQQDWT
ncbi:DUF3288 family protein [Waterburya agarophytonicola K14]|uniref:DUF3288 family protein n=1 Tax=Waterburya agarophytonicola KI4 TaxID=2874699 RepID=A0A964BRG3_9CYAN|nr:DUF3288 family protein [Waterburya agarophytonicola]MCC0177382.1 DUF3288 family protein [Waterburya agarophytonicola KI4]